MGFPDGSVRHYDMDLDVNNFLYMADIVLYWSFIEEQNFPPLLLQAMSFEIPIVAPNMSVIQKYVSLMLNLMLLFFGYKSICVL